MQSNPRELRGVKLLGLNVCSWCPTTDGPAPPTAVALVIETEEFGDIVCRLKSPEIVDQVIQSFLRHKRDVWPEAR